MGNKFFVENKKILEKGIKYHIYDELDIEDEEPDQDFFVVFDENGDVIETIDAKDMVMENTEEAGR